MALPPLILIHGYPFDHTLWDPVTKLLQSKTTVLTPDLRAELQGSLLN